MSVTEFNELTPLELSELMNEWGQIRQNEYRQSALLNRRLALEIVNSVLVSNGGRAIRDARQLLRFSWEDDIDDEIAQELLNTNWEALDFIYTSN